MLDTSLRLMLPAVDPESRAGLVTALAASAPPPVVDGAPAIAGDVLAAEGVGSLARIARSSATA